MNFLERLSEKEKEFFKSLQTVDVESLWGLAISNVVTNPDPMRFRRLICELKSQAENCSEVMLSILGQQCFNNLLNL